MMLSSGNATVVEVWQRTGDSSTRATAALAAAACAAAFLALGMRLWWQTDFPYSNPYDVRGWVWANQYPKQQDMAAFVIAILAVVLGAGGARFLLFTAAVAARSVVGGTDAAIRIAALPWLALGLASPWLAGPAWGAIAPVVPWMALAAAVAALGLLSPEVEPVRRGPRPRWAIALGCVAVYTFYYDSRAIVGFLNLFEDGNMLAPLQSSLEGGVVFVDNYLQHGLFHNLGKPWIASWYDLSLTGFRSFDAICKPFGMVALFVLGAVVLRSPLTALLLALCSASPHLDVSDRQTFGLLAVAAAVVAVQVDPLRRGDAAWKWFAVAGACSTLAFFYSVEIGLYSIAACGGFTILAALFDTPADPRRRLLPGLCFGAGALAAALPFLVYFAARGALSAFVDNVITQCTFQAAAWGLPFDPLTRATDRWSDFSRFAATRVFRAYFPPAVFLSALAAAVFRLSREGGWQEPRTQVRMLVALAGLAWFRTALGRYDPYHLAQASPLLWLITLELAEHAIVEARARLRRGFGGAAVASVARAVLVVAACGWLAHAVYRVPTAAAAQFSWLQVRWSSGHREPARDDRLGAISEPAQMVDDLRALVRRIRELTADDDYIFDFTNQGSLYFLADRRIPDRYAQVVYYATPQMNRELIAELKAKPPSLVIFSASGPIATYLSNIDGVTNARRHPEVLAYLEANYHFAETVGGAELYLPNRPLP